MPINSVIFAFGYKQRSGKDTAVAEIIKQRGLKLPVYNMEDRRSAMIFASIPLPMRYAAKWMPSIAKREA